MGIERFFNSLTQVKKIKTNGIKTGLSEKIISNFVYIDFNSVVHNISSETERDLNYLLYAIILHEDDFTKYPLDEMSLSIIEKYSSVPKQDGEITNIFNTESGVTVDNFINTFNREYLDEIILIKIKEHIIHITTKMMEPTEVKQIYIAFDGVPQMSKVVEQKKRRYNSYVIGELKAKIFEQFKNSLEDKFRQRFELNKIGIDRGRITTRASLMDRMFNMLSSDLFKDEMHMYHTNLEQITISSTNVYGEGEKKIMEDIIKLGETKSGTYTIYSPDADVVILGIICLNRLNETSNINILRFNQQLQEYDYVDVLELRKNIYEMVLLSLNPTINKINLNEITISNDLAFIFTLFGNDFLPRMEAIDARNDIETLIATYCEFLNMFDGKPLIFYENGYRIKYKDKPNKHSLITYLSLLSKNEEKLLKETYMAATYKNYKRYKNMLGVSKLLPILESYTYNTNAIFTELMQIVQILQPTFSLEIPEDILKQHIKEYVLPIAQKKQTNEQYMKQFIVFEKRKDVPDEISMLDLFNIFCDELCKKVKACLKATHDGKKFWFGKLKLEPYETDKVDTPFHEKNIKDTLPHPLCNITKYDEECYKLERKLMEYESKLNSVNFELGKINVISNQFNSGRPHYVVAKDKNHIATVETYYKTFFGMTQENSDAMFKDIVYQYSLGLLWIFDFYFNRNSTDENITNVSTWMYPYHRAPLLSQIVYYIEHVHLKDLLNDITKSYVDRSEYLNVLEHYMYVTPKHRMQNIPPSHLEFINMNPDIYPDLTETVNRIWTGDNVNEIIDCKRINFLSKCNLLEVKHVSYLEYFEKIKILRNFGDIPNINITNLVHKYETLTGGTLETKNENNKLNYYKNYFKMLYIKTGIIKYKKYYKSMKSKILRSENKTSIK